MSDPVNLTNLREMTDGDMEMEKMLFEEFYLSSEKCIFNMENSCVDGKNEKFYTSSHALKGTAMNLGAEKLGELCKKAQEKHDALAAEKKTILEEIKLEYQKVKAFLQRVHP